MRRAIIIKVYYNVSKPIFKNLKRSDIREYRNYIGCRCYYRLKKLLKQKITMVGVNNSTPLTPEAGVFMKIDRVHNPTPALILKNDNKNCKNSNINNITNSLFISN